MRSAHTEKSGRLIQAAVGLLLLAATALLLLWQTEAAQRARAQTLATPIPSATPQRPVQPSATPQGWLPDLRITWVRTTVPNSNCDQRNNLGTEVTIYNGGGNAGGFSVVINGQTRAVAGLPADTITRVWVAGTAPWGQNTTAMVDSANQVVESNEGNNSFNQLVPIATPTPPCPTSTRTAISSPTPTRTKTMYPPLGPDLVISDIKLLYSSCGDAPPALQVTFTNQGNYRAAGFVLRVEGYEQSFAGLERGQLGGVQVPANRVSGSFSATIDVYNQVWEIVETNNAMIKTFPTPTPCGTPTATRTNSPLVGSPTRTRTPTNSPTRTRTSTPIGSPTRTAISYPAWEAWTSYAVGARVSYGGASYQCIQAHTSQPGWEPPNVPALWARI